MSITISSQHTIFPRKIWQTWKVAPANFGDRESATVRSWHQHNAEYRYEIITDDNSLEYVKDVFGSHRLNRPEIITIFTELKDHIIKADLLRYIIIYAEGGIYADVDVEALAPFSQYIPKQFEEAQLDLIIGIETDEPSFKDHPILGYKAQSFVQWVFVAKPQHPVMMDLINGIVEWLKKQEHTQGKSLSELHFDFDDVIAGTGPSAFTTAVLRRMSVVTHRSIEWNEFHDLRDSKVIGGVLVLPAEAFAAGTLHSKSGTMLTDHALVRHLYGASAWTKSHKMHANPIYGAVEKCNWNRECVDLWDMNVKQFNTLSKEEQTRLIEMKDNEQSESGK